MSESIPRHLNVVRSHAQLLRVLAHIGWFRYHAVTSLTTVVALVVGLTLLDPYLSWPVDLVISVLLMVLFLALGKYLRMWAKSCPALYVGAAAEVSPPQRRWNTPDLAAQRPALSRSPSSWWVERWRCIAQTGF